MATAREPINRPDTYQRLPIPPPHLRSAAGPYIRGMNISSQELGRAAAFGSVNGRLAEQASNDAHAPQADLHLSLGQPPIQTESGTRRGSSCAARRDQNLRLRRVAKQRSV